MDEELFDSQNRQNVLIRSISATPALIASSLEPVVHGLRIQQLPRLILAMLRSRLKVRKLSNPEVSAG
jgi:hypothetical protein